MILICVSRTSPLWPSFLLLLFSIPFPGDVNEIDIICVLTPKLPLLATEKYQYTSALCRGNLNMSRAKKGAASEGQAPVQKEAAASPSSIEQLVKELEERMGNKFQGLKRPDG